MTDARYNFVDMVGQVTAGVEVLRRRVSEHSHGPGNVIYTCRILACGCEVPVAGIQIRAHEQKGTTVRCKAHEPTRKARSNAMGAT